MQTKYIIKLKNKKHNTMIKWLLILIHTINFKNCMISISINWNIKLKLCKINNKKKVKIAKEFSKLKLIFYKNKTKFY